MSLSNAFYTSRVSRSIGEIAQYVKQAVKIADGIQPAGTEVAKLKSTSRPSRPIVNELKPSSIRWDQRADKFEVEFLGQDLSRVRGFALIPGTNLDDDKLFMNRSSCVTKKSFKAEINLKDAQAGKYHAWVRNQDGMEYLLLNAFSIEAEKTTTAPYPTSPPAPAQPPYPTSPPAPAKPPYVVVQPKTLTVEEGKDASFNAQATGTAPFTYQWQKGGNDLDGECRETLNLYNVTQDNAGQYQVKVIDGASYETSNSATLEVTKCSTTSKASAKNKAQK